MRTWEILVMLGFDRHNRAASALDSRMTPNNGWSVGIRLAEVN